MSVPSALHPFQATIVALVCGDIAKADLTIRQFAVLMELGAPSEPMKTIRGLSARLKLPKPSVCRSLDTLARLGLADRVPDEKDRRSVNLVRTPKGQKLLAVLATQMAA